VTFEDRSPDVVFTYLKCHWGERWKIDHDPHGEWIAERRSQLDDTRILAGFEILLVADDLPELHRQLNRQDRIEQDFWGGDPNDIW
jgi:hypothetical protein